MKRILKKFFGLPDVLVSGRLAGMLDTPKRVALYLRVSTDEQRERQSIETQEAFLMEYVKLYGLEVAETYRDEAVSGTVPLSERPDGARMLADASGAASGAGISFDSVIVYRLDRLGRSLAVVTRAHDELEARGVALKSATEPIETASASGRLIFQMLASFAEFERASIRDRTQAGLHRALRNGKQPGRIPYGYEIVEDGTVMSVVDDEAEIVTRIIEDVAGGKTLYETAKYLNDLGVPAPGSRYKGKERKAGSTWSPTTVHNIVRQRAYSGTHVATAGDTEIARDVPAIVVTELQERAVNALSERKGRYNRPTDRKYLLRGLVKCGVCGSAVVGHPTSSRGKKLYYYICADDRPGRRKYGPPYHAPYVRAEPLEAAVWDDVSGFLRNPGPLLRKLRKQAEKDPEVGKLKARHAEVEKSLKDARESRDRYVRLYAKGHLGEEELEEYLSEVDVRIENLRKLSVSARAELEQREKVAEIGAATEAWIKTLGEKLENSTFDTRREILGLLVEKVVIGGKKERAKPDIHITYRFADPASHVGGIPDSCESGRQDTYILTVSVA